MEEKKSRINKKYILYHLGSILMVTSIIPILLIYYPFILIIFKPQPIINKNINNDFIIYIPKIKVNSKIVENVNPWNEKKYRSALEKGIAHAKGTYFPGENKTVFLFGHSSDVPWRITKYNTEFFLLGELEKNDQIIVIRKGVQYYYKVRDKKIVFPNDVKYIKNTYKNQLILQTCYPVGTAFQRLLVFADPV